MPQENSNPTQHLPEILSDAREILTDFFDDMAAGEFANSCGQLYLDLVDGRVHIQVEPDNTTIIDREDGALIQIYSVSNHSGGETDDEILKLMPQIEEKISKALSNYWAKRPVIS